MKTDAASDAVTQISLHKLFYTLIISRSMTLLLAYITIFSGIFGYLFSERNISSFDILMALSTCVLSIFSLYIFTLLFALIASRRMAYKGSPPKEIFIQKMFNEHDPKDWHKIILYSEVIRIQTKIERIQALNIKRMGQFRAVLKVSLLFVVLFVFALIRRKLSVS